jgi:septum formation protein
MMDLKYRLVLASQSPRRQYLLKELGLEFEIKTKDIEEDFPTYLRREEIPLYLCEKKAAAYNDLEDDQLLITADTIVWVDTDPLNKPKDKPDAIRMLNTLSGRMHEVITAVCLKSKERTTSFYAVTDVYFKDLTSEEIEYYVDTYKPYDKAGAYGAQEWIGYIGIEKIHGSYFNVMGLPLKELYEELMRF